MNEFSKRMIKIIKQIPAGKVITYGLVAEIAGNSNASLQVSRLLNSSSEKYKLPWHRVINSKGEISLPENGGLEIQKKLLENEGIRFNGKKVIDFKTHLMNRDEIDFDELEIEWDI